MRRAAILANLVIAFLQSAQAQIPVNVELIRKSVVFIYGATAEGQPNTSAPLATGFFVDVPLKGQPSRVYRLLVTARHVVDPAWAGCPPHKNPKRIFLRLNLRNFDPEKDATGVAYLPLDLNKSLVNTSVDDSVDAAAMLLNPQVVSADDFDINPIMLSDFATAEELKGLDSGAEVVSAGLLPAFTGVRRNYPTFKFGHISSIPSERVQVPCAPGEPPNLMRLWFVAQI